jgi:hypothetical protein
MRKTIALLLTPALFAQACASAPPASAPQTPPTLEAINQMIEGQPVRLRLRSGEVVREAEEVVLTEDTTSWQEGGRRRSVPTADVCEVDRQIRHRAGKGYAWGLLGCAPVAIAISHSDRSEVPLGQVASLLLSEGICAFIGMFIAAGLKEPPDRVVYTAPGDCAPAH